MKGNILNEVCYRWSTREYLPTFRMIAVNQPRFKPMRDCYPGCRAQHNNALRRSLFPSDLPDPTYVLIPVQNSVSSIKQTATRLRWPPRTNASHTCVYLSTSRTGFGARKTSRLGEATSWHDPACQPVGDFFILIPGPATL